MRLPASFRHQVMDALEHDLEAFFERIEDMVPRSKMGEFKRDFLDVFGDKIAHDGLDAFDLETVEKIAKHIVKDMGYEWTDDDDDDDEEDDEDEDADDEY